VTASQTQKILEVEANFTRESSGCDGTHYAEGREEIAERDLMQAACPSRRRNGCATTSISVPPTCLSKDQHRSRLRHTALPVEKKALIQEIQDH
jgi:hypothetical protein